jgi:hypothetical protein
MASGEGQGGGEIKARRRVPLSIISGSAYALVNGQYASGEAYADRAVLGPARRLMANVRTPPPIR